MIDDSLYIKVCNDAIDSWIPAPPELKPLPTELKYTQYDVDNLQSIITSSSHTTKQEHKLNGFIQTHCFAMGWTMDGI